MELVVIREDDKRFDCATIDLRVEEASCKFNGKGKSLVCHKG
jgi:hypothetical protein